MTRRVCIRCGTLQPANGGQPCVACGASSFSLVPEKVQAASTAQSRELWPGDSGVIRDYSPEAP